MLESVFHIDARVLVIGISIAACCSLLSTYVVLRRMALIAEGVAHAGFGGYGVALLAGYAFSFAGDSIWAKLITGVFCLGTAMGIKFVTRSKKVHDDSAIGIFLVAAMALGLVLIKMRMKMGSLGGVSVSPESLLFGDFLAAGRIDALLAAGTAAACFAVIGLLYHQFLYTTLDEEMARVNGVPTRLVNMLQLVMVSLVIVMGSRMVGALMITAMTIIPGATGAMLSRKFNGVMGASLAVGIGGTFGGLLLSYNTALGNFPPGAILVLTLFAIFAIVWTFRHMFKPKVLAVAEEAAADEGHGHSH